MYSRKRRYFCFFFLKIKKNMIVFLIISYTGKKRNPALLKNNKEFWEKISYYGQYDARQKFVPVRIVLR